jgi:hypothetical protein
MARFKMDDHTVVDTESATRTWYETTRQYGMNLISVATGTQTEHETLYRSRKGRYYIVHTSARDVEPYAEWVSDRHAASWMLTNDYEVPEDLEDAADQVSE